MFRDVVPGLAQAAHVIAPTCPAAGNPHDVLPVVSFLAFGEAIAELLDRLRDGPRFIYLHPFGAPLGLHIAMQAPERNWEQDWAVRRPLMVRRRHDRFFELEEILGAEAVERDREVGDTDE